MNMWNGRNLLKKPLVVVMLMREHPTVRMTLAAIMLAMKGEDGSYCTSDER
jgi:hypothetical protein